MSDSFLTSTTARNTSAVQDLTRQERPAAALTLTRSGTLAITTAGTDITWQTQTRGQGITWSTTNITIPTAGYYSITVRFSTAANVTMLTRLVINGTNQGYFGNSWTAINYHVGTTMQYFATGDVLKVTAVPSGNTTINVAAEYALNESPILHVVQLTSVIT